MGRVEGVEEDEKEEEVQEEVAAGCRVQRSRCGPSILVCMTPKVNLEEFSCGL